MNWFLIWIQGPAAKALGWTLVHSVWEGAAIALVLALALRTLVSARTRYAAACLAMLALLAGFGITFSLLEPRQPVPGSAPLLLRLPDVPQAAAQTTKPAGPRAADFLPWLSPLWMAGVLLFHLRSLISWIAAQRLRRTGVCAAEALWQERLNRLRARLWVSAPVALLESCQVEVPVVIGYLRPVILMPVGLLAGLPAAQVEAILLHELAHIRRYDYLVNLLQSAVEGFLFYHPAVWWISGVMRAERENCCDDMVVAASGDPHTYAVALTALEENRWSAREAVLAATGGNLVKRVRRLLQPQPRPRTIWRPVLSAGILTVAGVMVLAAWQTAPPAPSLSASFQKWLTEDVAYIITDQERAAFNRLGTDAEREHFIEQFWLARDPTPGTERNEFKEEHYRRIAYANGRFSRNGATTQPGWKTDRGRIYILWGPPDEIEAHPSGGTYQRPAEEGGGTTQTFPFEQWLYRYIDRVGSNVIVEFVDRTGSGDYRMTSDPHAKEVAPYVPGQSGGKVFVSNEPGAQTVVEITPDRLMLVTIPLESDAPQYWITGKALGSEGTGVRIFNAVVTLCKNSLETVGCLDRPVYRPPMTPNDPLAPGSYTFEATVKNSVGGTIKNYTVKFTVK